MQRKEYKLPNGKTAVFEYDACEIGKITLECMDELMGMIADRPQGEWVVSDKDSVCSVCGKDEAEFICGTEDWYGYGLSNYCPNCGAKMKGADDESENRRCCN